MNYEEFAHELAGLIDRYAGGKQRTQSKSEPAKVSTPTPTPAARTATSTPTTPTTSTTSTTPRKPEVQARQTDRPATHTPITAPTQQKVSVKEPKTGANGYITIQVTNQDPDTAKVVCNNVFSGTDTSATNTILSLIRAVAGLVREDCNGTQDTEEEVAEALTDALLRHSIHCLMDIIMGA